MSRSKTELERIQQANRLAEEYVNQLSPEVVEKWGYANLVYQILPEYLLAGLPSEELREQLKRTHWRLISTLISDVD
jgi:hypothetical protein